MAKPEIPPEERRNRAQKRHEHFRQTILKDNPFFTESDDYNRFLKQKKLVDTVGSRENFYESRSKTIRNELREKGEEFIRKNKSLYGTEKTASDYKQRSPSEYEQRIQEKKPSKEVKEQEIQLAKEKKAQKTREKIKEQQKKANKQKNKEFVKKIKEKIVSAPKRSKKTLANIAVKVAANPDIKPSEAIFKPEYPKKNWFPTWAEKHKIKDKLPEGYDYRKPFPKGKLTEGEYRVIRTYYNNPDVSLRNAARGKITGEKSRKEE